MTPEMNKLFFVEPTTYHNNFGLQLWGDPEIVSKFDQLAHREFGCHERMTLEQYEEKNAFRCFWQGRSPEWIYLEFWMDKTPENRLKIETVARKMADELKVPFFGGEEPIKAVSICQENTFSETSWFAAMPDGSHKPLGFAPHAHLRMGRDENRQIFVNRDGNFIGFASEPLESLF